MLNVDLNGSDGPTKTTVDSIDARNFSEDVDMDSKKAYDIITLTVEENGDVGACTGWNNPCTRSRKYLGVQ